MFEKPALLINVGTQDTYIVSSRPMYTCILALPSIVIQDRDSMFVLN